MTTKTSRTMIVLAAGAMMGAAGCADIPEEDIFVEQSAILGDRLPRTRNKEQKLVEFKANFQAEEEIDEGLGPIFNAEGCAVCHDAGAIGGASATPSAGRYRRLVN